MVKKLNMFNKVQALIDTSPLDVFVAKSIKRKTYKIDVQVLNKKQENCHINLLIGNQAFHVDKSSGVGAIIDLVWMACLLDHALAKLTGSLKTKNHCERCKFHGKYSK
jgi:hypothetical protein